MLLPEIKEREYRFKLALRIGLPIFALILAFISHTLIANYDNLQTSFYVEALILMTVSIYFILYLIYNGFSVKITDDITKTFTREYIYDYLKKEITEKKSYTLVLVSIDNLADINTLYGIKNGDKVLRTVAKWIAGYFQNEKIENFPMGHIKGGEFLIGLQGNKERYSTILELMCLKASEFKVEDIEVKISSAIIDTSYSKDLDYLVERLFELLEKNKSSKNYESSDEINPSDLESTVITAIEKNRIDISYQNVYNKEKKVIFKESFIKLYSDDSKRIYPKLYLKIISKLGLSVAFDITIFENILAQSKENEVIAINIFPTSLRNEKFLSRVKESLQHKKVTIMFILSEMEYYSYTKRYNSILRLLKQYNVKIVIDRIGSLHTSFLYLRELEVDMIRFDTYYSSIERLRKNRDILLGFNTMAHEKGISSWIKNIENEESYTLAKEIKIDFFQGKYLSKVGE
jgi:EAL domain-containing protein (putative c-di-GMP-specific phosphodiesterase class I)